MKTLRKDTSASLPGRLCISRHNYVTYFKAMGQSELLLRIGCLIPYDVSKFTGAFWQYTHQWTHTKEVLLHGCLCPTILLDKSESIFATCTNLNGIGERSIGAIKVFKKPVNLLPPDSQHSGSLFASACVYYSTTESEMDGRWSDIEPYVVDYFVPDRANCQFARERISDLAWQSLQIGLTQIPKRPQEGLYLVDIPHEILWNAY